MTPLERERVGVASVVENMVQKRTANCYETIFTRTARMHTCSALDKLKKGSYVKDGNHSRALFKL